jgi:hypothetical protein
VVSLFVLLPDVINLAIVREDHDQVSVRRVLPLENIMSSESSIDYVPDLAVHQ